MKRLALFVILGLLTVTTNIFAANNTITLDTLILYSQGVYDKYNGDVETRVQHLITTTNQVYKDSGLNVKLNPVKIQQYPIDDSIASITALENIRKSTEVANIRNEVGADHVIIYRPYRGDGDCGRAYQNNALSNPTSTWVEKYMYAHISIDCSIYATAHEVGHNAGLGHSERQGSTGAYSYARGHGIDNTFTTIMAYTSAYNGQKIAKFSNPNIECINGLPCGIEEGEYKEADAVKALKQTLPLIEKFRVHIATDNNTTDNNTTDNNTTDNNTTDNNTTDNNTTDNNHSNKLEELFKEYQAHRELFIKNRAKLEELRSIAKKLRSQYLDKRNEYMILRKEFMDIRTKVKQITSEYRVARKNYTIAKRAYKRKRISYNEFLEKRANYSKAIDRLNTYRKEIYKPTLLKVRAYIKNVLKPMIKEYNSAIKLTKKFYRDTYKPSKRKLEELEKAYFSLKNG